MTGGDRPLEPGDRVLLVDPRGRRYLISLAPGRRFHFHRGIVEHDELIGSPAGGEVVS
jgi:tRNA (adenine57-N1/adenine58-N1)-methyltransferase